MKLTLGDHPRLCKVNVYSLNYMECIALREAAFPYSFFCVPKKGQVQLLSESGVQATVSIGEMLLVKQGTEIIKLYGTTNAECYVLWYDSMSLNSSSENMPTQMVRADNLKGRELLIRSMIEQLLSEKEEKSINSANSSILSCIYQLFADAVDPWEQENDDYIEQVKKYIQENYREEIVLADLSEHINVSIYHLSHIFKDKMGVSPIKYVIQCRMEQAKKLLLETNLSVTEIAGNVGYNNSNYFSMLFKKMNGQSPRVYRRQKKK